MSQDAGRPEDSPSRGPRLCLVDGKRRVVRGESGRLMEPSGQMLLEFSREARENIALIRAAAQHDYEELSCKALALETSGRFEEAAAMYRDLLTRWPEDFQLWFNYGNTLFEQGHYQRAADAFREATTYDSHSAEAWNNLGGALMELGKWSQAKEALQRSLALNPHYGHPQENLTALPSAAWRVHPADT